MPNHATKPIRMDFIDLKAQQERIRPALTARIQRVLDHGQYILGPEVQEMEHALAKYVGVKHCLGVASGTDALLIALMALGVSVGDEVITTPFTFIASAEVIALIGAVPVFVDIDPITYNMDPGLIQAAISKKTKAILAVSLYGQCADMEAINRVAAEHGIPVIEDAAQSFGATRHGRQSCGLSLMGCTSFFPSKPLGCYGDGGAIFTDDDRLATLAREIRIHGQERRYHHSRIGVNGRMDTLQAAVVLCKLDIFGEEVERRWEIGQRYSALIDDSAAGSSGAVISPRIQEGNTSVYAQFTVEVDQRDKVAEQLQARGIPTAVHYPTPLHLQPAFAYLGKGTGHCEVAERAARRVISLPMHPYLREGDQETIVQALSETAGCA